MWHFRNTNLKDGNSLRRTRILIYRNSYIPPLVVEKVHGPVKNITLLNRFIMERLLQK